MPAPRSLPSAPLPSPPGPWGPQPAAAALPARVWLQAGLRITCLSRQGEALGAEAGLELRAGPRGYRERQWGGHIWWGHAPSVWLYCGVGSGGRNADPQSLGWGWGMGKIEGSGLDERAQVPSCSGWGLTVQENRAWGSWWRLVPGSGLQKYLGVAQDWRPPCGLCLAQRLHSPPSLEARVMLPQVPSCLSSSCSPPGPQSVHRVDIRGPGWCEPTQDCQLLRPTWPALSCTTTQAASQRPSGPDSPLPLAYWNQQQWRLRTLPSEQHRRTVVLGGHRAAEVDFASYPRPPPLSLWAALGSPRWPCTAEKAMSTADR